MESFVIYQSFIMLCTDVCLVQEITISSLHILCFLAGILKASYLPSTHLGF